MTGSISALFGQKRLDGRIQLMILDKDRLTISTDTCTVSGKPIAVTAAGEMQRLGTHYLGVIELPDGDPENDKPDYQSWTLSITDLNDSNGNGIPNLSDTGAVRPPVLSLSQSGQGLLLSISSEIGGVYQLQFSSSISSPEWLPVQSLSVTNDPQTLRLTLPSGPSAFWRLQMP
jgi:hypothetical protein